MTLAEPAVLVEVMGNICVIDVCSYDPDSVPAKYSCIVCKDLIPSTVWQDIETQVWNEAGNEEFNCES